MFDALRSLRLVASCTSHAWACSFARWRRLLIPILAVVLATTVLAPIAAAGPYEDGLAIIEATFGPIGDTNDAEPGGTAWQIIQLTIISKQLKSSGNDAEALEKLSMALEILEAMNRPS